MKNIIVTIILALSFTCFTQARTWTSTAGTSVDGELTDFVNRTAIILTTDGRRLPVQLQLLSEPDQAYVQEWFVAKKGNKKGKATSATKSAAKLSAGLADLLPEKLMDSDGNDVSREQLAGKTIGFYFSAHWCPPCRTFTPSLVKFRDTNQKDFEIVFVSSDKNPAAQMAYMKETKMKWLTMPHRGKDANALAKKYGVRGIPALIIVSSDGETITKNGRSDVSGNPKGALASWQKP
ncbi:MAG: thioredoxin family protein [Opitutales bacterium]|jgi:nucleoredoxin